MSNKLAIITLGHQDSGKSETWKRLFGGKVRTGKWGRYLEFPDGKRVRVFLINGSPQETGKLVEDFFEHDNSKIVLCSVQYHEDAFNTLDYFIQNGYFLYCHWLNPGYHDSNTSPVFDHLGISNYILSKNSIYGIRSGKIDPIYRVNEISDFIYSWSSRHELFEN